MTLKRLKPSRSHLLPFAVYLGAFLAVVLWAGLAVDRYVFSLPNVLSWVVPVLTVPAALLASTITIPALHRYAEKYPDSRPLLQPNRSTVAVTAVLVGAGLLANVLMFWGLHGISHPLVDLPWSLVFSVPLILTAPSEGYRPPHSCWQVHLRLSCPCGLLGWSSSGHASM